MGLGGAEGTGVGGERAGHLGLILEAMGATGPPEAILAAKESVGGRVEAEAGVLPLGAWVVLAITQA